MKKFKIYPYVLFLIIIMSFQYIFSKNPLVNRPMGDPSSYVFNNKIYAYCKKDRQCRQNPNDTSWTCISSSDLKNWNYHGHIFTLSDIPWAKGYAFACDAEYKNGKYYLYVPVMDSSDTWRCGIGISSKPEGPFSYHGQIDVHEYDPMVYTDDTGQSYIYFPGRMAKLDDDMVSIENGWRKREEYLINGPLDEEKYTTYENPFVFKRKDKYYYLLSIFNKTEEGGPDVVEGQYVHYWIGDSPMGPFKYQDVLFDPDDGHTALGNIGTSVVKYKDQWLFFYHERFHTPERGCTERKPCMDTLHFNDKGLMKVAGKEK